MTVETDVETWKAIICQWYPKILEETYFVPPVTINRIPLEVVKVVDETVLVPSFSSSFTPIPSILKTPSSLQMQALPFINKAPQENVLNSPLTQTFEKGVSQEKVVHSQLTQTFYKEVSVDDQLSPTSDKESKKAHSHGQSSDSYIELQETSLHKHNENKARKEKGPHQRKILDKGKTNLKNSSHLSQDHLKTPALTNGMWTAVTSPPLRVQEGHLREDLSLQKVLFGLQMLTRVQKEVMFVVSQLQFSNYLNKTRCAATDNIFPRSKQQGDFDLLLIHRYYGILIGEIKSIRSDPTNFAKSQAEVNKDIVDKIQTAIRQLDKAETVFREITADKGSQLFVHKTCVFPYISRKDFKRILNDQHQLKQDLSQCMKTEDLEQAIDFCLLSDNLPDNSSFWNVKQLQTWWNKRVSLHQDPSMTSDVYLELVARFCGPATTVSIYCVTSPRVEVRTQAEGVAVVGERMAMLVLTHEQIDLLTRSPPKVMLTGGPGVGKTVVLALKAIEWVHKGQQVHIISTRAGSVAASFMLHHVVQETVRNSRAMSSASDIIKLHLFDIRNKETDEDLATSAIHWNSGIAGPYVIIDEFWAYIESAIIRDHRFIAKLCSHFPQICLWAASPVSRNLPKELQEERMTVSLRCPPHVTSEVEKSFDRFCVYPYASKPQMTSCFGINVMHFRHDGPRHAGRWPVDCEECGRGVAEILNRLISTSTTNDKPTVTATPSNKRNTEIRNPPPLEYRDVFVLTRCTDICDDIKDQSGNVTSKASGMVRGLRAAGIAVHVIKTRDDVYNTALSKENVVAFAHDGLVCGLERKVVVWLPHRVQGVDDEYSDEDLDWSGRLHAMSRSTAQLILVDVPNHCQKTSHDVIVNSNQCTTGMIDVTNHCQKTSHDVIVNSNQCTTGMIDVTNHCQKTSHDVIVNSNQCTTGMIDVTNHCQKTSHDVIVNSNQCTTGYD